MGSELRIVEVGSNILQFKFSSSYQRDWVENSGPWNFENNLLLLCRWRKGLTIKNIVFTHSPFWVQLWGLPFELMSEEVGQDIGRSLGRLIEVDKRACQSDQTKFMRIRVDLPIDKPLRRGGNVVSKDGEKFWIHFKYERLPTFCFLCGMLGHDDKHCQIPTDQQGTPKQYGECLRANGNFKGGNPSFKEGNARKRTFSSNNQNAETEDRANGEGAAAIGRSSFSLARHVEENRDSGSFQNSKFHSKSIQRQDSGVLDTHISQTADVRLGWDIKATGDMILGQTEGSCGVKSDPIPMEKFESMTRLEECSGILSKSYPTSTEECYAEVSSPLKPNNWAETHGKNNVSATAQVVTKSSQRKCRMKKIAREQGSAQGKEKKAKGPSIGSKHQLGLLLAEEDENTAKKRTCMEVDGSVTEEAISSAVAAVQHRREP